MKKQHLHFIMILLTCVMLIVPAAAEIDVYGYTYDELVAIREQIDARLKELDREHALENADRALSFEQAEQVLFLGRELRVLPLVTVLKEGAPRNTTFTWTSSDPAVASVANRGTVRALAQGDAVITATAADNQYLSASFIVHAAVPVEKITVWGSTDPLYLSNTPEEAVTTLGFSVEPEDAYYQTIIWSSSDESIATVDENGQVQALTQGTVTITALSAENPPYGKEAASDSMTVTVKQKATGLQLSESALTLPIGVKGQLTAAVQPENVTNPALEFTSDNPEIATVDKKGSITPVSVGECTITCKTTDGSNLSASCAVTVYSRIGSISLPETTLSMAVGSVYTAVPLITPADATNQDLLWTSSNVFVARVANGTIEAVGQGECEITCTTLDGSELSATMVVRVPTFSIKELSYSVTEKTGLTIPVQKNVPAVILQVKTDSPCFTAELDADQQIIISPLTAGTGTVTVENPMMPEDSVFLQISIENSAVYNQTSYPPISYMELVRIPDAYEGAQISIYGKILHISETEDGTKTFMVGTAGDLYTDQVMFVRCDPALTDMDLSGGEFVTVYGLFHMEHTFSEILQADTLVPAMETEKIVIEQP